MNQQTGFVPVVRALQDLLGASYVEAVSAARTFLRGDALPCDRLAPVDFYPSAMQERLTSLLGRVGQSVCERPLAATSAGAGPHMFNKATHTSAAPLSAFGYFRVGEEGRLYLTTKSEHYHAPLGHAFPGYRLVEQARALGVPNATHNNTRGFITRHLEEELVRIANGFEKGDSAGVKNLLSQQDDLYVLNRVLNLETGSLVAEAALKLALARFYRMQLEMPEPKYQGRTPVILVMGNDDGGLQANYHGTTVLTQMMRGMWPECHAALEGAGFWKVVAIRPNNRGDLERAFATYETGDYKIAAFFHEIVMMNYGGRLLTPEFLHDAHARCQQHDVVTVVDEIQSCMWAPELFMFREYGLKPSCVVIGKGFPGGEYPASRILFSSALDVMPQFGALVTNGQEELASLAYLITMEWALTNAPVTAQLGHAFECQLRRLAADYPGVITAVDGWRHMTTLCFAELSLAQRFVKGLTERGLDVSAQTYKKDCPPIVLFKLPLTADRAMIDFVIGLAEKLLTEMA